MSYVVEVNDDYRRAINLHYGKPGLASRNDVKFWLESHGDSLDPDILQNLWVARARGEEPYLSDEPARRDKAGRISRA